MNMYLFSYGINPVMKQQNYGTF